ncbi:MAG: sporulation protein YunB, partial [Clostridiales bacterium]|nr:sporulation protein YunB [Clostridiales bacterium]
MAKRSARRLRLRRALRILLLIALLGSVLYLLLEKSLTQVILNTAYAKAYAIAVETMNEAVRESLQSGAAYEDLITVRTDGAGRITMLAANTARMNELAVSVALRAQSALETRDSASIAVPLGAALKAPFFSSLGPRVPVRLSPVGSVSAAFATEFEA